MTAAAFEWDEFVLSTSNWGTAYSEARWPNILVKWDEPGVYVFRAGHYVKIGWSHNIWLREEQLQYGKSKPVLTPDDARPDLGRLIAAWPGTRQDEAEIHAKLRGERAVGEWFWHTEYVEAFIVGSVVRARAERQKSRSQVQAAIAGCMKALLAGEPWATGPAELAADLMREVVDPYVEARVNGAAPS